MNLQPPKEIIILFTRYPVPGLAKTRLIPALGREGAADLHKKMTEHAVAIARKCCQSQSRELGIRYTGADRESMTAWLGAFELVPQGDGSLGDRLARSFADAFEAGAHTVVVIGSDCPELTPDLIDRAFALSTGSDLVLGPTKDGGYYLIGLRRPCPELFRGIAWGSAAVLAQTLARAGSVGLRYTLLPTLNDVDRPADLRPFTFLSLPD